MPYIPPVVNPAAGASLGTLFMGTGANTAGWQQLTVAPNGGSLSDPSAALSALLNALRSAGVDTSGITGWARGFAFPPVNPDGANLGTGFHVQYSSDAAWAPVSYVLGTPIVWSNSYDPLGRGFGVSRSLKFVTGAGTNPWPGGYLDTVTKEPGTGTLYPGGGPLAPGAPTTGQQLVLLSSTSGDGWALTKLQIRQDTAGGPIIDSFGSQ